MQEWLPNLASLTDTLVFLAGAAVIAAFFRWWIGEPRPRVALAYGGLVLAFFAVPLLTPAIQLPVDYLYRHSPWRETLPAPIEPQNPLLTDVVLQMLPFRTLVRERLLAGEIPLWAHELGTGQPLLGNAQSAPFAPLHLMALPLPVLRALTVAAAWQVLVALLGMHLLLLELGAHVAGAAFAAVAFGFSTFSVAWLYHPHGMVAAWVPAFLLALVRLGRGRRLGVTGLVATSAAMLLSGQPQIAVHAALAGAVIAVALLWRAAPAERKRFVGKSLLTGLIVFGLTAPGLLPILEVIPHSERKLLLEQTPRSAPGFQPLLLLPALHPLVFGSPRTGDWDGPENFNEACSQYAGMLTLLLALAGLWVGGPVARLALGGGFVFLLAAHGAPGLWQLLDKLPLLADASNGRLRLLWILGLAVAAGLSLERIARARRLRIAAIVVLGIELFGLGLRYHPIAPPAMDLAPPKIVARLQELVAAQPEPVRSIAMGGRFLGYVPAIYGLWDPRGWDPMRPAAATQLLREQLHRPALRGQLLQRRELDPAAHRRLGLRYVLGAAGEAPGPPWQEVFADADLRLWENPETEPLFFLRAGEARIAEVLSNGFEIEVESPQGGTVASSVTWLPGWRLRLDGRPAEARAVDGPFLGFDVGPGRHRARLVYSPVSWRVGVGLFVATVLGLLAIGLWRRRAAQTGLVLGLLLCGCAGPGEPTRFIEQDTPELLDPAAPFAEEVVADWPLDGQTPSDGTIENPPLVYQAVAFDASEVQVVEATMAKMPFGELRLSWSREGEGFSLDRHMLLPALQMKGHEEKVFTFPVVEHPGWSGRITALQLHTSLRHRAGVVPRRLRVLRRVVEGERLAAAVARPWKVALGHDLRSVLLAPPGLPLERELVVPRRGALRFAYGAPRGLRVPVSFEVWINPPGRAREQLFTARLEPGGEERWHEAEVDLGELAGQKVRLALETSSAASYDLSQGIPLWANPEVLAPERKPELPNVILISLDTLRADHLSLYGYQRATSPQLDGWAKQRAVVFRHAVAQAPSTLPSHASMFSGLDAFHHGVNHYPAPPSLETLAEILRRAGYATFARTGGGYLNPRYGLHQGFDVFRYWLDQHHRDRELEDGVDTALKWLDENTRRPFFLLLHTYEVHGPYRARQPWFDQLTGGAEPPDGLVWIEAEEPTLATGFRTPRQSLYRVRSPDPQEPPGGEVSAALARDLYDSSIRHVDEQLARLFSRLEALDLDRRTVVIITSDHGEAFGEHGLAGHGYLYDDNLLVPLIVALPEGRGAGKVIDDQVRSIDLLPTLTELLGLPVPAGIDGVSLLPLIDGRPGEVPAEAWSYSANNNYGVSLRVRNRYKYLFNNTVWPAVYGEEELFRLDTDPAENESLAGNDPQLEALRRRTASTLESLAAGLVLRLANAGERPLRGVIEGELVAPTRVKSVDLPCPCLDWREHGQLGFTVPPGKSYTLWFEGDTGRHARIKGTLEGEEKGFDVELRLDELTGVEVVERVGERWQERSGGAPPTIGWSAAWQGRSVAPTESYEPEPELLRQLRALGYVH